MLRTLQQQVCTKKTRTTKISLSRILFVVANVVYTVRDCTTFLSGKPCDVYKSNVEARNETLKSCYSCQSDLCNKSNGLRGVLALVVLALVAHYVFTKL